jgi:CubicO group peptidase (beta-lactamase class C family)
MEANCQYERKAVFMRATLLKLLGIFLLLILSLFLAVLVALSIFDSPEYARRLLMYGQSDINDYLLFPERVVMNASQASTLSISNGALPQTIKVPYAGGERSENLADLNQRGGSRAFIVVKDDQIIYEGYFNGAQRDSILTSFSSAKSFNSAMIGAAIAEGRISSVNDPVVQYIPEISGRGLEALTIRDLLLMSTGIRYRHNEDLPFYQIPFSEDALTYYSPDLRRVALGVRTGDAPIGQAFLYNNYHPLLEGLILERVSGMRVAEYLQEKFWAPMGAEYAASWSLDGRSSAFEKMESGINARAIDYARFGLIFLHEGYWNGQQILPADWVRESTSPDGAWEYGSTAPGLTGYYKYHWWGYKNADGSYDFYAAGRYHQIIYVAPRKNMVIVRLGGETDEQLPWPLIIHSLVDQIE